jgi:peptidoglycan hydrolase-like protein with peptidoglycan-binding domain
MLVLKKGDRGQLVRSLKNGLAILGHLSWRSINDQFDENTAESVKLFQAEAGLEETGEVDDETWTALSKAVAAKG